jgi:hypothetical protein
MLVSHGRGHGLALVLARKTVSAAHPPGPRRADPRSTPTPPAGASHCCTRRRRYWSPPGGLQCREPASCRATRYNPAGSLAHADDHGRRPWGRAWRLRGELPYGQGGHGLGQAELPGERLGRSPGGALGDAAGDRHGRPAGGRRHRRGHQGSAAGYLGAIGGRLHAVWSPAAAGLASSLAGPSLVRGTRRNNGQPRIITDTDRAAHGPYRQAGRRAFCPLQRRGHRFEPCHAHQPNPQASASRQVVPAVPGGQGSSLGPRRGRRPSQIALAGRIIASSRSRKLRSASGYRCP